MVTNTFLKLKTHIWSMISNVWPLQPFFWSIEFMNSGLMGGYIDFMSALRPSQYLCQNWKKGTICFLDIAIRMKQTDGKYVLYVFRTIKNKWCLKPRPSHGKITNIIFSTCSECNILDINVRKMTVSQSRTSYWQDVYNIKKNILLWH